MLRKGIICKVDGCDDQYISNIFTKDKKDGTVRVVLDLSDLNEDVVYRYFKMDS